MMIPMDPSLTHAEDEALLAAFAHNNEERALSDIVTRHAGWLFAAAYRQLRDRHQAEDAVQGVFILLARKARHMKGREKLTGWLFNTLQFTIRDLRRAARRRQRHEREVQTRQPHVTPTAEAIKELSETLDQAV